MAYTKKIWEDGLKKLKENVTNGNSKGNSSEAEESKEREIMEEKYELVEKEKNLLIERNGILL